MPPVITISSTYSITADIHQFIIMENGRMIKFFPKLENALDWILRAKIRGCNVKSIEQLGFTIKKHSEALCGLVTSLDFQSQAKILSKEVKI